MHCVVVAVRDVAVVVGSFKVKITAERVDWRLALHFPTVPAGAAVGVGIVGRATVLERGHGGCVVVLVKKEMTTIKLGFAGNASGNHENILECLSNPDFEPVLRMLGVVPKSPFPVSSIFSLVLLLLCLLASLSLTTLTKLQFSVVGELYKSIKSKANGGVLQSLKSTGRAKKNTGTLVHLVGVDIDR